PYYLLLHAQPTTHLSIHSLHDALPIFTFRLKTMGFKHTGIFPEQAVNWDFAMKKIQEAGRPVKILNLFGYTGAATLACMKAGARSEEHTSELQSRFDLVCRLLLEKK